MAYCGTRLKQVKIVENTLFNPMTIALCKLMEVESVVSIVRLVNGSLKMCQIATFYQFITITLLSRFFKRPANSVDRFAFKSCFLAV